MKAAVSSLTRQMPRVITGVILAAALITCLVLGGPWLTVALALVGALALHEFFQMFWPGKANLCTKLFGLFMALALFCPVGGPAATPIILTLVFVWTALAFLFDYGRGNDQANLAVLAPLPLGFLYIPALLHLALSLTLKEQFLVVAAAIASDMAGYYVGCAFGKHKIWPRVSPQKSWEGSIAGLCATVAATVGIACIPYGDGPLHGGSIPVWIAVGVALNIAAQLGDFFESALKRVCRVKDSGTLLPGHGGVLDRIDAILFTLAAYSALMLGRDHILSIRNIFASA